MQSIPVLTLVVLYAMAFVIASGLASLCMAFIVQSACEVIAGFRPYYDTGLKVSFLGMIGGGVALAAVFFAILEVGDYVCVARGMCISYAIRASWAGALGVLASFVAHGFVFGKMIDDPEMVPIRLWRGHAVSVVVHVVYLLLAAVFASMAAIL